MNFITIMAVMSFAYYLFYMVTILSASKRKLVIEKNMKLDKLRRIPVKTIDEQKEFINTKYPKMTKFDWKSSIVSSAIFIVFTVGLLYLAEQFKVQFGLWDGLLVIVLIVFGVNVILRPFKLHSSDIDVMTKW